MKAAVSTSAKIHISQAKIRSSSNIYSISQPSSSISEARVQTVRQLLSICSYAKQKSPDNKTVMKKNMLGNGLGFKDMDYIKMVA